MAELEDVSCLVEVRFGVFWNRNWDELSEEIRARTVGLLTGSFGFQGLSGTTAVDSDAEAEYAQWHGVPEWEIPEQQSMVETLAYLAELEKAVSDAEHAPGCLSHRYAHNAKKRRCNCFKGVVYRKNVGYEQG